MYHGWYNVGSLWTLFVDINRQNNHALPCMAPNTLYQQGYYYTHKYTHTNSSILSVEYMYSTSYLFSGLSSYRILYANNII